MSKVLDPILFAAKPVFDEANKENRLSSWFNLLRLECEKLNLVSRETLNSVGGPDSVSGLERLTVESILPLQLTNQTSFESYLDIGSGGGFPAIPIILTHNVRKITLIERTQKKAVSLKRMLYALHPNFKVFPTNLDELKLPSDSFDLITLRLVKLDSKILKHIHRLLSPKGCFIYYYQPDSTLNLDKYDVSQYLFDDQSGHKPLYCTLLRKKMQ